MAKFDSQYPEQVTLEAGDTILIAASQDGSIMKVSFDTLAKCLQLYLNIVDDRLSSTSEHPVQNKVITEEIIEQKRLNNIILSEIDDLQTQVKAAL